MWWNFGRVLSRVANISYKDGDGCNNGGNNDGNNDGMTSMLLVDRHEICIL